MVLHGSAHGFSLIEVLVALVVLSIGLLGLASLQATGMRVNDSAYARSQAQIATGDLIDRLRADRDNLAAYETGGFVNQSYNAGPAPLDDWIANRLNRLASGMADIDCNAAGICTIGVRWDDRRAGGSQTQTFTTRVRP